MSKLRDLARGMECTVRISPPCDPATVVAHHVNRRGHAAIGGKVDDLFMVHVCHRCHTYVHNYPREPLVIERMFYGMVETLTRAKDAGLIEVKT